MSETVYNPFTGKPDYVGGSGGSGNVSSTGTITDNSIVRGDGGARNIQDSGVLIDDSDNMTALASIALNTGATIDEFSTDGTLGGNSDTACPTEKAVKTYVDTNYQPLDAGLTDIAGLAVTDSNFIVGDGANWVAETGATARTSLGLGTIATQAANSVTITGGSITGITDLAIADGGTGQSTQTAAFDALSPTTTKGDIVVYNGSDNIRLAVGSNTQVLTADSGEASGVKWAAGGGGSMPAKEYWFAAESLQPLETNFGPLEKLTGTNVKTFVRAFDDTTEEFANCKIQVPGDVDTSGTATFRVYAMAKTAVASKNVKITIGHLAVNDSEDFDQAYTDVSWDDQAIDATQDDVTEFVLTETVSNLTWAANDLVFVRFSREAATTNNLSGDMYLFSLAIELPRA